MTAAEEPAAGEGRAAAPRALRELAGELRAVVADSEKEMETLGRDFEGLAGQTNFVLENAGEIISCIEGGRMGSVLPGVRQLESAAKDFLRERLGTTARILEAVAGEAALLERLAQLTRGQKAIVRETEMLRVLTNIEVARLGEVGAGFQYLAHELDDFSQTVARSTNELTSHTDDRRRALEETRRTLEVELPRMREEFRRIEESLDNALSVVETTLGQTHGTPLRFRACVEGIAGQIGGVVAAIQAHDITRQQIEHVYAALGVLATGLESSEEVADARPEGLAEMRAGLTIQSYQLRNVRETVRGWTTQIRTCLEGIAHIASSEILDLAPLVLGQESALAAQLTRIERLEQECETGNAAVQESFAGIYGLMQLVGEHLERSKSVRDRLQLLMFNSIVEASHLGTQADGILEISTTIKRISAAWAGITAQSEAATAEIRERVEQSREALRAFSDGSDENLRAARARTMDGLGILREGADCAESRGRAIQTAIGDLQAKVAGIGGAADRLESCFGRLEAALEGTEAARRELKQDGAPGAERWDMEALERQYSAGYTTEMERAVLRAALTGGPLPAAQQSFAGNSVELF